MEHRLICPCCGNPLIVHLDKDSFPVLINTKYSEYEDIQAHGLEFGLKEGGGEDG